MRISFASSLSRRLSRSPISVVWIGLATCGLLGLTLWAGPQKDETCRLTLQLVDSESNQPLAGMVRITDGKGQPWLPPELLARDLGRLPAGRSPAPLTNWAILLRETAITVPRQKLTLEALSGLETELEKVSLDLTGKSEATLPIRLKRLFRAADQGYRSANTHLHLMYLTREQSDRYLSEVTRADGLDVLFVSYLERPAEQQHYISNRYSRDDLEKLSRNAGVAFGNGEEHRHNLAGGFGEGYGHVMLLDIPQLVQPVSLGKSIMQQGSDGVPVQRGIDAARKLGGTVLWCHNDWGLEDIANWVTGRLHAQNIFDGAAHGSYQSSFYRYLNSGLYDFSRVYVPSPQSLTPKEWLRQLAAGRSFITNGPFLEFRVDRQSLGDVIAMDRPATVHVTGKAIGRVDFRRLEVVQNGVVIRTEPSRAIGKHFEAAIRFDLSISAPCWLALRIPPPPSREIPELKEPALLNELNQPVFAHTSAVHVQLAGRSVFDATVVHGLIVEMQQAMALLEKEAEFADASEKGRVLDVYREAIRVLTEKLEQSR